MIRLFSIIALLVLSVSVSSVFVESAYAAEADAIQVILDISYENIQESLVGVEDAGAQALFQDGEAEYLKALAALEIGDIEAAEGFALSAMEYFEDSAILIGEELEVQEATIQPLGLGTASSIFNVQEAITSTDSEADELRELIKLNDLEDIDDLIATFDDFD